MRRLLSFAPSLLVLAIGSLAVVKFAELTQVHEWTNVDSFRYGIWPVSRFECGDCQAVRVTVVGTELDPVERGMTSVAALDRADLSGSSGVIAHALLVLGPAILALVALGAMVGR